MKRWLLPILAALVLLSGCSAPAEPTTAPTTLPTEVPVTEPAGCYDPGSTLESATNGAVRIYATGLDNAYGIVSMGEDLIVFSGNGNTVLTKLSGENLYVTAETTLSCCIFPENPCIQSGEKGFTYYDDTTRELVFLGTDLTEVRRFALSDGIIGRPALSQDRKTLYYCTADSLRSVDLESGIDRLVKEMSFSYQNVEALHLQDTVVACSVQDRNGSWSQLFINAATGETLYEAHDDLILWSGKDRYFATRSDGAFYEMLTGTDSSDQPSMLHTALHQPLAHPVLNMDGVVLLTYGEENTRLDYYDLATGMRPGCVELSGTESPWNFLGDPAKSCVWFLRYDKAYGDSILCRWDPTLSPTGDDSVNIGVRRTPENPDLDGLEQCAAIAEGLSKKHGVQILTWTDATATQPWDYELTPEYQVTLLRRNLEILDDALSWFPEGLLEEAASGTSSGEIRICLVRGITGIADTGALTSANGLQFWDQEENAFICVTMGSDMEQALYHELFHIIDSRVLSTCSAYDSWNELNPEGFDYDYDYTTNLNRSDWELTEGESRAFIDLYSMSYPKEDRARIMEHAMMSGNEHCFTSETMQAKLRRLCLGIREAFGLEDSDEVYRWEQYLTQPIQNRK